MNIIKLINRNNNKNTIKKYCTKPHDKTDPLKLLIIYGKCTLICTFSCTVFYCYKSIEKYDKKHDRQYNSFTFMDVMEDTFVGILKGVVIGLALPIVVPALTIYAAKSLINKE